MEASALPAPVGLAPSVSLGLPLRLRSDEQLLALFRAGNEDAFRVIHDRYRQRLFAYTRQMLPGPRQDAEDALQDVFVRAYFSLRSDDRELALRAWLYRVAHNRCVDQLRRPAPPPPEALEPLRAPLNDPLAAAEQREALRRLVADVRRLPEQQRSALLMRELGGMSYVELARVLGISVSAVKSLLVRARVGLAQAAQARDTACSEIRDELAEAHERGVRPSGLARRHLRDCASCREFRRDIRGVSRQLAALAPLGPLAGLAKLLGLGGGGAGAASGAAASGAAGSAAASTGFFTAGGLLAGGATHAAALLTAAVLAAGGAVELPLAQSARPAPVRVEHLRRARVAQPGSAATALAAQGTMEVAAPTLAASLAAATSAASAASAPASASVPLAVPHNAAKGHRSAPGSSPRDSDGGLTMDGGQSAAGSTNGSETTTSASVGEAGATPLPGSLGALTETLPTGAGSQPPGTTSTGAGPSSTSDAGGATSGSAGTPAGGSGSGSASGSAAASGSSGSGSSGSSTSGASGSGSSGASGSGSGPGTGSSASGSSSGSSTSSGSSSA